MVLSRALMTRGWISGMARRRSNSFLDTSSLQCVRKRTDLDVKRCIHVVCVREKERMVCVREIDNGTGFQGLGEERESRELCVCVCVCVKERERERERVEQRRGKRAESVVCECV